jgi:hypothetical protein
VWVLSYDSWKDNLDHVNNVRQKLYTVIQELLQRAAWHDSTKFESPEKESYDEHTDKLRGLEYGSKEYKAVLDEMRPAIDHHYQHNSHHPEHYSNGVDGMNLIDLMEMLADWKAAKERHKDKPTSMVRSLEINAERFGIDMQLRSILWNTLRDMGWTDESNS